MMDTTCFCSARFATVADLDQHATHRGHRIRCDCGKRFKTPEDVLNHQITVHKGGIGWKLHPSLGIQSPISTTAAAAAPSDKLKCNFCNKLFKDAQALKAHKSDKHPACPVTTCNESFVDRYQLKLHKKERGHCYCDQHDTCFPTLVQFRAHTGDGKHVTGFECVDCARSYSTQQGLNDHLQSEAHAGVVLAALARANDAQNAAIAAAVAAAHEEASLRCEECNRKFKKLRDFKQHKASLKHNKLSDLKCPFSDNCKKTFPSPSSLLFHLESGKCKSGMNRDKLDLMVHMHDTSRHITHHKNAASVLAKASAAGSLPSTSDAAAIRSALSNSGLASVLSAPRATSVASDSVRSGRIREVPDLASDVDALSLSGRAAADKSFLETSNTPKFSELSSDAGSDCTIGRHNALIEEIDDDDDDDDDDDETICSASGGAPISLSSHIHASSIAGPSIDSIPLQSSTHSRASSVTGGVRLSTASSQIGDWSHINTYKANPPTNSTADSSIGTLQYDSEANNWPCTISECKKTFREQEDLLAHRKSPAHAPELYHCPTGLEAFGASKRMKGFKTLSGFAQHIEAGACAGGKNALKHIAGLFEAEIAKATGKQVRLLTAS